MRSIYNAYKTLFYHEIMSVTMATDNLFLEFYNGCSILLYNAGIFRASHLSF